MHDSDISNSSPGDTSSAEAEFTPDDGSSVSLSAIGWDTVRAGEFAQYADSGLSPGRVARVDGISVLLIVEDGTTRAEGSSDLQKNAETAMDLPAAGDWVGFRRRPQHDTDVIEVVLPRRSQLTRTRQVMDTAVEKQVVAVNIDFAFVVHAANNVNLRRLEREAALVASNGAEAVIVLNKADLHDDIEGLLNDVQTSVPLVSVHAVSGATGDGVNALAGYSHPDRTVAFIGASGVGKSTLTNQLLGREAMDTGEVREDDQRGRHTTTVRHLIPVPGGGALIDTPGMRSLGLSGDDDGVAEIFDDITELASACRFNDCSHIGEPGCAVMDAISRGDIDEKRLASFRKLSKEVEFVQSKSELRLRHIKRDMLKARAKKGRQATKARKNLDRSE